MNRTIATFDTKTTINRNLLGGVHRIFDAAAQKANKKVGKTQAEKHDNVVRDDGGYKCIHLEPGAFCEALGCVLNSMQIPEGDMYRLSFIDIGCGVGEKVYLASLFGLRTFGLELRRPLINEGRELLESMGHITSRWEQNDRERQCFIQGNALEHDYKEFDILYFYCPLFNFELQTKLEDRIHATAKPGAVVIPALPKGKFALDELKGWTYHRLPEGIYRPRAFYVKDK